MPKSQQLMVALHLGMDGPRALCMRIEFSLGKKLTSYLAGQEEL